jgi:hypothetical protein
LKEKTTATSVNEDTSFALSLVPTLRSLPEENKLQARIEILSTLQKFKFQSATNMFHPVTVFHSAPSPSTYQFCKEQYHSIPTHVHSNPPPTTSHQMSFPPFQSSVQQPFHSNIAFSPNIPPVNQIANDPSSSINMQNEPAISPASVASDLSESTVSDILGLD